MEIGLQLESFVSSPTLKSRTVFNIPGHILNLSIAFVNKHNNVDVYSSVIVLTKTWSIPAEVSILIFAIAVLISSSVISISSSVDTGWIDSILKCV